MLVLVLARKVEQDLAIKLDLDDRVQVVALEAVQDIVPRLLRRFEVDYGVLERDVNAGLESLIDDAHDIGCEE